MATLYGTSGSDTLNGTSANDTLVYNISQNSGGTQDFYKGGSGIDTVLIEFTRQQWLLPSYQAQIASYLSHLATVTNPTTGEVPNNSASDFTFTFGASTLRVRAMERLTVTVDGVYQDPADAACMAVNDSQAVTEDSSAITVNVLANDSIPDLVKDLALGNAPIYGTATLMKPDPSNASTWYFEYQVNQADCQSLAVGQSRADSFTYVVTDADGDTSSATVNITITGTNDGPGAVDDALSVLEGASASALVLLNDTDPDDGDTLQLTAVTQGSYGSVVISDDQVTYTPDVTMLEALATSLAAGASMTMTDTFTYTVSDAQGATDTASATVTIGQAVALTPDRLGDIVDFSSGSGTNIVSGDFFSMSHNMLIGDILKGGTGQDILILNNGGYYYQTGNHYSFGERAYGDIRISNFEILKLTSDGYSGLPSSATLEFRDSFQNNGPLTIDASDFASSFTLSALFVSSGAFNVIGGASNDALAAGSGNDTLSGGNGHDGLVGHSGADTLTGGAGSDSFFYVVRSNGGDHITDFTPGSDCLGFYHDIYGDYGDDAFYFGNQDHTIDNFRAGDDNLINQSGTEVGVKTDAPVETATVQSTIDAYTNITTGAVFVFLNQTVGHAQVYYDADPSTAGGATLIADLDNITVLGVNTLSASDFAI